MAHDIAPGRTRPGELYRQFGEKGWEFYERAYRGEDNKGGSNLSVWLNKELGYDKERGLDGFEQLIAEAGITTQSIPHEGIWADTADVFLEDKNRALLSEFMARQWRKVSLAPRDRMLAVTQALQAAQHRGSETYMSSDVAAILNTGNIWGAAMGPVRVPLLEPAVPLAALVATTTGVQGTTDYQELYLVEPPATDTRMIRITETSEIPRAKVTLGRTGVKLYKYGRALEASYEAMRRLPIDLMAFHIQRIAVQSEIDKASAVVDVLINGDGNSNSATSTNISTLDAAATGGAITVLGWVSWEMGWNTGAYRLTSILVQQATGIKLQMLAMPNANPLYANVQGIGGGRFMPMNDRLGDRIEYGVTTDVGATQILGFDRRQAINRIFEIGGDIQEVARFANRQTEAIFMTEVEGYSKINVSAARILNLA